MTSKVMPPAPPAPSPQAADGKSRCARWWQRRDQTLQLPVPAPLDTTAAEASDDVVDRIHRSLSEGLYPWW